MVAWILAAAAVGVALFLALSRPSGAGALTAQGQPAPPPARNSPQAPSSDPLARTIGAAVNGAFAFFASLGDRPETR